MDYNKFYRRQKNKTHLELFSRNFLVLGVCFLMSIMIILQVNLVSGLRIQGEYFNGTDADQLAIRNMSTIVSQTFTLGTVGTNNPMLPTSISAKLYKFGSPGYLNFTIYSVDGSGKPNVSDAFAGSVLYDTSGITSSPGAWYNIPITSYKELQPSTQYALVSYITFGDNSNFIAWRVSTTDQYAGGQTWTSENGGSTWTDPSSKEEALFQIYEDHLINITLNSPSDGSNLFDGIINFNISTESTDELQNVSIYLNGVLNETKPLSGYYDSEIFNLVLPLGSYNWSVRVYSNITNSFSSNRSLTVSDYFLKDVSYNTNSYETSDETFVLSIEYNETKWNSISTIFYYNNTQYTTTKIDSGSDTNFTSDINIPISSSTISIDNDFYWKITLSNSTSSVTYYTSNYTQEVSPILFSECSGGTNISSINFTLYDESSLDRIFGFNFDSTFLYYTEGSSITKTFTISEDNINEKTLCINQNFTFKIDTIIQYDKNSSGFVQRNYFLQNFTANGDMQNINLYLLNESSSTSFILKLRNTDLLPLPKYIIEIQRYYPGTDSYNTVQVIETDDNGQGIGFFKTETVDYRFVVKRYGEVYLTTTKQKIVPETSPYTLTLTLTETKNSPWFNLEDLNLFTYTSEYSKTSGKFTYTYSDSSGNLTLGKLLVYQINMTGPDRLICNESSTSPNSVLECNLGSEPTGTYYGTSYITRNQEYFIDSSVFEIENFSDTIGLFGIMISFFVILIAASAFFFNEIAGIWAVVLSIITINFINITSFGMVFITGILAVAIILTVLLKR